MQPQLLLGPLFIRVKNVGIIQGNKQEEITDIIEKKSECLRMPELIWFYGTKVISVKTEA